MRAVAPKPVFRASSIAAGYNRVSVSLDIVFLLSSFAKTKNEKQNKGRFSFFVFVATEIEKAIYAHNSFFVFCATCNENK